MKQSLAPCFVESFVRLSQGLATPRRRIGAPVYDRTPFYKRPRPSWSFPPMRHFALSRRGFRSSAFLVEIKAVDKLMLFRALIVLTDTMTLRINNISQPVLLILLSKFLSVSFRPFRSTQYRLSRRLKTLSVKNIRVAESLPEFNGHGLELHHRIRFLI